MSHAKVVTKRIRTLELGVESGKRDRAEIFRHVSEIDFAAGRLINAPRRTLGNVISVKVRPDRVCRDVGNIRRIVELCERGRGGCLEAVETEPDGGFLVAEQIVDHGRARRECLPGGQLDIDESRNIRETSGLCGLPYDSLADIFPSQAIRDRHPLDRPRVLGVDPQIRIEVFLPACRSGQQCHRGWRTI